MHGSWWLSGGGGLIALAALFSLFLFCLDTAVATDSVNLHEDGDSCASPFPPHVDSRTVDALPWLVLPLLSRFAESPPASCRGYRLHTNLIHALRRAYPCRLTSLAAAANTRQTLLPSCLPQEDERSMEQMMAEAVPIAPFARHWPQLCDSHGDSVGTGVRAVTVITRAGMGSSTLLNTVAATLEWQYGRRSPTAGVALEEKEEGGSEETASVAASTWIHCRARQRSLFAESPLGGSQDVAAAFVPLTLVSPSSSSPGLLMLVNQQGVRGDALSLLRTGVTVQLVGSTAGTIVYSSPQHDDRSVETLGAALYLSSSTRDVEADRSFWSRATLLVHQRDVADVQEKMQLGGMRSHFTSMPKAATVLDSFPVSQHVYSTSSAPIEASRANFASHWNLHERRQQQHFIHSHQALARLIVRRVLGPPEARTHLRSLHTLLQSTTSALAQLLVCSDTDTAAGALVSGQAWSLAGGVRFLPAPDASTPLGVSSRDSRALQSLVSPRAYQLSVAFGPRVHALRVAVLEVYTSSILANLHEAQRRDQAQLMEIVRQKHTTLMPDMLQLFREGTETIAGEAGKRQLYQQGNLFYHHYSLLKMQLQSVWDTAQLYLTDPRPLQDQISSVRLQVEASLERSDELRQFADQLDHASAALVTLQDELTRCANALELSIAQTIASALEIREHQEQYERQLEAARKARERARWFTVLAVVALAWTGVGLATAAITAFQTGGMLALAQTAAIKIGTIVGKGLATKALSAALPKTVLANVIKTVATVAIAHSIDSLSTDSSFALQDIKPHELVAPVITATVPGVPGRLAGSFTSGLLSDASLPALVADLSTVGARAASQHYLGGDIGGAVVAGFSSTSDSMFSVEAALDQVGSEVTAEHVSRITKDHDFKASIYATCSRDIATILTRQRLEREAQRRVEPLTRPSVPLSERQLERQQLVHKFTHSDGEHTGNAAPPPLSEEEAQMLADALEDIASTPDQPEGAAATAASESTSAHPFPPPTPESPWESTQDTGPASTVEETAPPWLSPDHAREFDASRTKSGTSRQMPPGQAQFGHEEKAGADSSSMSREQWVSLVLDVLPLVGTLKATQQLITGEDYVTGEEVNRGAEAAGLLPWGKLAQKSASLLLAAKNSPLVQRALTTIRYKMFPRGDVGAYDVIQYQKLKDGYRPLMERPFVHDPALQSKLKTLHRDEGKIGSGSTAAAVRYEKTEGKLVGNTNHAVKLDEGIRSLEKWLAKQHLEVQHSSSAKPPPRQWQHDRAGAENMLKDMREARDLETIIAPPMSQRPPLPPNQAGG